LHQHTIWEYIHPVINNPPLTPAPNNLRALEDTNSTQLAQVNITQTPQMTPIAITFTLPIQEPQHDTTMTHQQSLTADKHNDPWGNIWAVPTMAHTFRIASKNTGTINPQNLDMQAIMNKLHHLSVSVFAGQETNIHWDTLTSYQSYQQCKSMAMQIKLTMASSQEPAVEWYKPGSTLLLTLNPWTSRIVAQGSHTLWECTTYHQPACGTNSRHPQKVTQFCKHVVEMCNQLHLAERIVALRALTTLTPAHYKELEAIDNQLTQILL